MLTPRTVLFALVGAGALLPACSRVLGLDDFHPQLDHEAGGAGGFAGAAGVGATGSAGSGGVGGVGGTSGSAGVGGAQVCQPQSKQDCYSGAPTTEGIGICSSGKQTCSLQGDGYGACEGEVLPRVEDCAVSEADENCDGFECGVWASSSAGLYPQAVAALGDGTELVAGTFWGTVTFAGEDHTATAGPQMFLGKVDSGGQELWFVKVDRTGRVLQLLPDPLGGAYLILEGLKKFQADPFTKILAVEADGRERWFKEYGGPVFRRGVADASGVVVAGSISEAVDFGDGEVTPVGEDAVLARFDRKGDLSWKAVLDASSSDRFNDVILDSAGDLICVGTSGDSALIKHYLASGSELAIGNGHFSATGVQAEGLALVDDGAGGLVVALSADGDFEAFDFNETLGSQPQTFLARVYSAPPTYLYTVDWVLAVRPFRPDSTHLMLTASGDVVVFGESQFDTDLAGNPVASDSGLLARVSLTTHRPLWQLVFGKPKGSVHSITELKSGEFMGVGFTNTSSLKIGTLPPVAPSEPYFLFKTGK